jgi:membrane-associated protein
VTPETIDTIAVLASLGDWLHDITQWLNAERLLEIFGTWAVWGALAIVFAECGLLFGFFFPGDSLLFTVGVFIGRGDIPQSLWLACLLLTASAVAGNVVGYEIGRAAGPAIFNRPDSRLFRQEYVDKTVAFFDKYGARAIVLARFVPIVRTFITVTAGVGRMDRRRYLVYSAIGGVLWATGITVLGYFLGSVDFVAKNIEVILILIVAVSVLPMMFEVARARRQNRRAAPAPAEQSDDEQGMTPPEDLVDVVQQAEER